MLLSAEQRLAAGDAVQAKTLAQQALDEKTDDPGNAYFILAQAAIMSRDIDGARTNFERAIDSAHETRVLAWSHIYLGRICDLQEDRQSALSSLPGSIEPRALRCPGQKPRRKRASNSHTNRIVGASRAAEKMPETSKISGCNQGDSMNRGTTVVVMLGLATAMFARQQTPATTTPAAGQQGATQKDSRRPARRGKRPPQAKTQAEFDAYKAAAANAADPVGAGKSRR